MKYLKTVIRVYSLSTKCCRPYELKKGLFSYNFWSYPYRPPLQRVAKFKKKFSTVKCPNDNTNDLRVFS